MRAHIITSLFCASALTGCKLHHIIHSETSQINATDLVVKHVYKVPKKNNLNNQLTRFNDPQLHQLITIALIDAPDIGSAKARVMRARQVVKGAYSTLWPSATLDGYLEKYHFSFQGTVPPPFNELIFNKASIADLALNFNYELDFWGKNRETVASRLNETFAAQMDLEETRLILSSTVATTYFELQNDIIQQQLAKENVRILKELEDIVLARTKQGIESDIPLKTAISTTEAARLSVQDYKRTEMQTRHQLAILLGKNPFNTQIETKKFNYNKKQLVLPAVISSNILVQRPDIAASRALAEAAAHQINVARAAFFPDINLSGILSLQSFYFSRFFNVSLQTEGIKAALSLPIFDAGARRANLGIKQAEFELTINQYNQTILNALQEISDHMSELQTLDKQIQDQAKALNTTEANYKLYRASYNSGIIDYVQLLEIKQVLVQQKATLYSLQTRQKQAFVALLAALGGEIKI
ncbi:efflux transporter outer membrane subunit [Legionella sp.]|uniref:efflux transporter outer membrane subunit n=1 Tax=Legionella sp. TaxID=459 RepID=UPI003CBFF060